MTCSRSCEIFALLFFLHFGESLGTANNRQKDLMMNSGKSRISPQNELREMDLQIEVFVEYNIALGKKGR